jgi:hypothetical protein
MNPGEDRPKWALLIGINRYPNFAPRGQLTGCVNDVEVMRQVLVNSFNFPENHVAVLKDEQASREGILGGMRALVQRVGQDDVVVFHYSGHGSQMTDIEGDEPDGLDETIVPYDSGRAPDHENRDIKDDEIYLWLRDLTAKTSAVTLVFDCCHSGTIVRDDFGGEIRRVEPDLRPAEQLPPSPIPLAFRGQLDGGRDVGPSGWLPLGERYVLISGCSQKEKSFEIEEPAGVRQGALTYFLSQELRRVKSGATYRDVFEAMAPRVSSRFPDQHPQLEGARDLEIFGVRWIEPMKFVPVLQRSADRVILEGGAACGLTEGSQWAIYPAGTKAVAPEDEPLGVVALTAVRAVTSEARLLREAQPGAVAAGLRAVEQSHCLETRMPVEVIAPSGRDVEALLDGLDRSRLLRRAEQGGYAKARVYLLPPRSRVGKRDPVPMLDLLREESWAVVGEDGNLLAPVHTLYEPCVVGTLLDNLEKVARYRLTLDLKNPGSELAGKVDVELLRKMAYGLEAPELGADGRPVFSEGECLALRISHRCDRPLYVYVLDLGLSGRVALNYPPAGSKDSLSPGRSLEVGTRPGSEIDLYFPNEFPFLSAGPGEEVTGFETLKILFTTHPAEIGPLLQNGYRLGEIGTDSSDGSLSSLLATTFGGGGYTRRDLRTREQGGGPEDWTTLDRSFRVRRPASSRQVAWGRGF